MMVWVRFAEGPTTVATTCITTYQAAENQKVAFALSSLPTGRRGGYRVTLRAGRRMAGRMSLSTWDEV
jgi:hypothetical protein